MVVDDVFVEDVASGIRCTGVLSLASVLSREHGTAALPNGAKSTRVVGGGLQEYIDAGEVLA